MRTRKGKTVITMAKIYLLEDDNSIRDLVVYTLNNSGFQAEGFDCGESFWEAVITELPELILLDIMLPGEDGLQILRKLKSKSLTADIPVIMLTAKSTEYDKVIGLDSGADDYIPKPFGMMELISRIKAVLRRSQKTDKASFHLRNLILDPKNYTVQVDGEDVILTLKEFELLKLLIENNGHVLTRDKILENIWGYDFDGETRTVDVHIRTLRTKLKAAGDLVETVRGIGYRIATVR